MLSVDSKREMEEKIGKGLLIVGQVDGGRVSVSPGYSNGLAVLLVTNESLWYRGGTGKEASVFSGKRRLY